MDNLKLLEITPGTIFFTEFASFTATETKDKSLQELGLPNPTSINWEGTVLTNEEKNAKGDLFLEFVSKKRKVTVNWKFLTQSEYRDLMGHLYVDFNNPEQAVLYYKVKALNPNNARYTTGSDGLQPNLDEMIAYLEGKYVGKITIYNNSTEVEEITEIKKDNENKVVYTTNPAEFPLLIGYEDVSLVFIER